MKITRRGKIVAGVVGGVILIGVLASAGETSAPPTKPATASEPAQPVEKPAQSPAEVTRGFCLSVSEKIVNSGMPKAADEYSRAAQSALLTNDAEPLIKAGSRLAGTAAFTADRVADVDRLAGLAPRVRNLAATLQTRLAAQGSVGVKYVVDLDLLNTRLEGVNKAMENFLAECESRLESAST